MRIIHKLDKNYDDKLYNHENFVYTPQEKKICPARFWFQLKKCKNDTIECLDPMLDKTFDCIDRCRDKKS